MKVTIAYVSSESAIAQFTKGIELEYSEQGIHANAIGAGVIKTDILAGIVEDGRATLASYEHMHALGRVGQPKRNCANGGLARFAALQFCDRHAADG